MKGEVKTLSYNYKDSRDRVEDILSSKTEIAQKDKVPSNDDEFTYKNGIKTWVGALFVDIVDSSEMCKSPDENTARIFRSFCSEIIAILKDDPNYREIGIRGDCVYSINTTQYKKDIAMLFDSAFEINTFLEMLNKQLKKHGMKQIKAGIGLGCAEELVVKAGQSGSGINDKIWIGKAVVDASKLGDKANRNGISPIAMSNMFYNNVHELLEERNQNYKSWIKEYRPYVYSPIEFYHCNIVDTSFEKWIDENV